MSITFKLKTARHRGERSPITKKYKKHQSIILLSSRVASYWGGWSLHKGGPSNRAENYRPISRLCISSKILEHIIHSNLINHLNADMFLFHVNTAPEEVCHVTHNQFNFTTTWARPQTRAVKWTAFFQIFKKRLTWFLTHQYYINYRLFIYLKMSRSGSRTSLRIRNRLLQSLEKSPLLSMSLQAFHRALSWDHQCFL